MNFNSGEVRTIPATPFQVTANNGATFEFDMGVIDAVSGLPYIKVASAPTVGQYSVSALGVYTFAAANTGASILLNYTNTVTTGQTLNITNTLLGTSPTFRLDYYTTRGGKAFIARFNQCQAAKISFASKLEDFTMPEFEIHMFADAAGNLGKLVFPEVA